METKMEETVNCILCNKPLHLIRIGKDNYPIYVHQGKDATACHMIKICGDPMGNMLARMKKLGKQPGVELNRYGRPKQHNEP